MVMVVPHVLETTTAIREQFRSSCAPESSLLCGGVMHSPTWLLRVASSSKKPGRWTTTPLPMRHCAERLRMPDGMRCSLYLLPSGS